MNTGKKISNINKRINELSQLVKKTNVSSIRPVQRRNNTTVVVSSKNTRTPAPIAQGRSLRLSDNSWTLSGTEVIRSVKGSTAYTNQAILRSQPGFKDTFPWLSGIASHFEKYRFKKLHFRFIPMSSTTKPGNIILSYDYDAKDAAPLNDIQASQYPSVRGPVWQEHIFKVNTSLLNKDLYITDLVPVGTDPKTYDSGKLVVGTIGGDNDTDIVGYVAVDYEVEFKSRNNVDSDVESGSFSKVAIFSNTSPISVGTSEVNLLSGLTLVRHNSSESDAPWIEVDATNGILFSPGLYEINFNTTKIPGTAAQKLAAYTRYFDTSVSSSVHVGGTQIEILDATNTQYNTGSYTCVAYVTPANVSANRRFKALMVASAGTHSIPANCINVTITKLY